jgi:hypothetical protein
MGMMAFIKRSKNIKGIYFTMDSVLAGGIIIIVILLASSVYVEEPSTTRLNFLSQDMIKTLSSLTVKEINNEYLDSLGPPNDPNPDNTILQQIGEYWADGKLEQANKTVQNVTEPWITNTTGFGVWINNESVYNRNNTLKKSLVSSKKVISGIAKGETTSGTRKYPPILWGPVVFETRVWE